MKNNLKILRIIQTLDPEYGGPANAIIDNSLMLKNKGFDVHILTYDTKNKIKKKDKKKIKIINQGPSIGKYNFSLKVFFWLLKNKKNYDIFIIHGIWHFSSLVARLLLKKKYFVFLHGGLDHYFKTEFLKVIKKKFYWYFVERKNLMYSKSILLTTNFEHKQLKNTFVDTSNILKKNVGYGILKPFVEKKEYKKNFYKKFPYLQHKKYLLFIGRFHPKKGLYILLQALKKIKHSNYKMNILMVGPENLYKTELKNYCEQNGLNKQIFWSNTLTGKLKLGAILCSDAMVLPSHGENFALSLVEALALSKPVLTTNKVGIHNSIIKYSAGFVSKNNVNQFSQILIKFNRLSSKEISNYSYNALKCFDKCFNLKNNIDTFSRFLKESIK